MRPARVRRLTVIAALAALAGLSGCSHGGGNAIMDQANNNDSNTSTVEQIAPQARHTVLTVSGTTLQGRALTSASFRGKVVVLNYWGSWCGPCQEETPDLKAAWKQLQGKDVQFIGLDSQESATNGLSYMTSHGLTYPSLQWDGGKFLEQLKGKAPAPPTTIILDQQGRLAARVLSSVNTTTLVGLVDDVLSGAST